MFLRSVEKLVSLYLLSNYWPLEAEVIWHEYHLEGENRKTTSANWGEHDFKFGKTLDLKKEKGSGGKHTVREGYSHYRIKKGDNLKTIAYEIW